MNIKTRSVSRDYLRNGKLNIQGATISSYGSYGGSFSGDYLPAIPNGDGTYTVDVSKVLFTGNILAEGEVTAYGSGEADGSTSTGSITIYDGLDSKAVDVALSANQGRVLKGLIDNIKIEDVDLSGYYNKEEINSLVSQYSKTDHTHTIANITDLQTALETKASRSDLNTHTGNTTLHITATERTNWNDAFTNKHTHSNKTVLDNLTDDVVNNTHTHSNKTIIDGITSTKISNWDTSFTNNHTHKNKTVLDGITSTKVSNWDGVVTDWDKAFYYDTNGNLRAKVNVIGEQEISAWGTGSISGSGAITIYDGLTSTATDVALSANLGRVLKEMIDNIDVGDVDLSGYYQKTEVDTLLGNKAASSHSHSMTNITNLLTALDGKASSSHTHSDYSKTDHSHTFASLTNKPTTLSGYGITDAAKSSHSHTEYASSIHSHTDYASSSHTHTNYAAASHTHSYASTVKVGTTSYNVNETTISLPAYPTLNSLGAAPSSHTHSLYYDNETSRTANTVLAAPNGSAGAPTFRKLTSTDIPALAISKITNLQSSLDSKSNIEHTHSYLSLSGGTLTGDLILKAGNEDRYLKFQYNSGDTYGWRIGYIGSGSGDANYLVIQNSKGSAATWTNVLRLGNETGNALFSSTVTADTFKNSSGTEVSYSGHTHSDYYDSTVSRTANTILAAPNGSAGSALFRKLVTADIPTLAISKISGLQTTLDGKSDSGHTHNYAGSSSAGGAATSANKVNSTLTFTGYQSKTFNGSAAISVAIPNNTNQLTNGAGFITSSASITGNAATATKLATARTIWGLSFNGTANVSGNITGSYFKINDTSSNPYLQLTLGSTWYIQGYNGYLYLGAGSTKSLRIDSSGNCLSVGELTAHSDKRLKDNIKPLEVRGELNPVTYTKDGKESIGFIADEVKELYPELVVTDDSTDEKYLSLNYAQLTAVLYAEIKELKKEINELKNKIK